MSRCRLYRVVIGGGDREQVQAGRLALHDPHFLGILAEQRPVFVRGGDRGTQQGVRSLSRVVHLHSLHSER